MICPNCKTEYREGFTICADCNIPLVDTLASERALQQIEFVTVLTTGNISTLMIAKSLLDEAGILYFAKGEGLQDLLGMGRLGTGFNVIAGPVQLQVDKERQEEARTLLADIESSNQEDNR